MSFTKGNRKDRLVNIGKKYLIYTDSLENPNKITRYIFCHKNIYLNYILE